MDKQKRWVTLETANQIKYYRHKKRMSQEELALKANLNPAYFGQIERGLKCPTVDSLYKISSALEIPLSELVHFSNNNLSQTHLDRLKSIASRIPEDKADKVFQMMELLVDLL